MAVTYHDSASGLARIGIFTEESAAEHHIVDFPIKVDDDMVAVGGGVVGNENPGKLLTASYPNADMSSWRVSAKDHIQPDTSPVTGYAIGLKLLDPQLSTYLDKFELLKYFHLTSVTSTVAPHPSAFTPTWAQCVMLGGRFKVNSGDPGSLATASFYATGAHAFPNAADNHGWQARSKDHKKPSPASITSYAVCLERALVLSDTHALVVQLDFSYEISPKGPHPTATAWLQPGHVVTGGGAEVFWDKYGGPGNMLWKLQPLVAPEGEPHGFTAAAKDHKDPGPCELQVHVRGIDVTLLGQ